MKLSDKEVFHRATGLAHAEVQDTPIQRQSINMVSLQIHNLCLLSLSTRTLSFKLYNDFYHI